MKFTPIVFLFVLLTCSATAQDLTKSETAFADSLLQATYKPDGPGAVLLIARKGQPVYRKACGLANLELNVPVQEGSVFRIASISKQFTAVCILKLAQEGKLKLEDDVRKYIPAYNTHGRTITIAQLLFQTSGIPSFTEMKGYMPVSKIDLPDSDLLKVFMHDSLLFEPGTDWSYSNSNYLVAGLIVEKASGRSLTENYRQTIFLPLGMTHSWVGTNDSVLPGLVNGYESLERGKFKPSTYESPNWNLGGGGIVTTVDDMLKWDKALYTDQVVKQEWLQKAWKCPVLPNSMETNYGMGWSVCTWKGLQILEHGGSLPGFSSEMVRLPGTQTCIILLSNSEFLNSWGIPVLLATHLNKVDVQAPAFTHQDRTMLKACTGMYQMHRIGSRIASNYADEKIYRSISLSGDTLFSQTPGNAKEVLVYAEKDLFAGLESNDQFRFHRNKAGKIESLEIYSVPIKRGCNELEPKTDLPLPKEKQAIVPEAALLNAIRGRYDFGDGSYIRITTLGNKIYMEPSGEEKQEVFACSETTCFLKSRDVTFEFIRVNGKITSLVVNEGRKSTGKKVE